MKKTKIIHSKPKPCTFNKAPENPDGRRAMCKTCDREMRIEKKTREEEYGKEYFKF
jgi:hypothetical protein